VTHYERLGVDARATAKEVARAFRVQALKCHPDKCPGDATAHQRFLDLTTARDVLLDADKRAEYDESLRGEQERVDDWGAEWLRAAIKASAKEAGVEPILIDIVETCFPARTRSRKR
jgi:DnaJ-class molecular chaperone